MPSGIPSLVEKTDLLRIADAVPAMIALYNIQTGEYLYINDASKDMLGYSPEEFTEGGMQFVLSLVHPDDMGRTMAKNQAALDRANANPTDKEPTENFEYRMKHKDGHWVWLCTEGTIFSRDESGQAEKLLNVSLDITERKKAQLQLHQSLKALERALQS